MHIDNYDMGRIEIDGQRYEKDLLIIGGQVDITWWREKSHVLAINDLQTVCMANPSRLIVGKGKYGRLTIPVSTSEYLFEHGVELEAYDTARACERFNELISEGIDIAAAFHLTC